MTVLRPPLYAFVQLGPELYTLATTVFDVDNCVVRVMTGNPLTSPVEHPSWPVENCTPKP